MGQTRPRLVEKAIELAEHNMDHGITVVAAMSELRNPPGWVLAPINKKLATEEEDFLRIIFQTALILAMGGEPANRTPRALLMFTGFARPFVGDPDEVAYASEVMNDPTGTWLMTIAYAVRGKPDVDLWGRSYGIGDDGKTSGWTIDGWHHGTMVAEGDWLRELVHEITEAEPSPFNVVTAREVAKLLNFPEPAAYVYPT